MAFWNKLFGKGKTNNLSWNEKKNDYKLPEQKMQYDLKWIGPDQNSWFVELFDLSLYPE